MDIKYEIVKQFDNDGPNIIEQLIDFFVSLYEDNIDGMEENTI